jgi:hypothetical protein
MGKRGTRFRIWASRNIKEYIFKGFVMDDELLNIPTAIPIILTNCWNVYGISGSPRNGFIRKYAH